MSSSPSSRAGERLGSSPALLDRGDIVNLLARLRNKLKQQGKKITVVQNRLIMQRIEAAEVTAGDVDIEPLRPDQQVKKIAEIVAEVLGMGAGRVETELRACRG